MEYIVDLEKFYGPLELLLYLVDKNEMDIYDIQVAEITRQYLAHMEDSQRIELDSLGDFLVMASFLLNLKSRLLLPVYPRPASEEAGPEEDQDPREQLVRMLLEYKRYKKAADYLAARLHHIPGRVFFRAISDPPPEQDLSRSASLRLLVRTYGSLMAKRHREGLELEYLPAGDIDVGEKMVEILAYLRQSQGKGCFQSLLNSSSGRREAGALFLALLELVRLNKIHCRQEDEFADIEIRLGDEEGWTAS